MVLKKAEYKKRVKKFNKTMTESGQRKNPLQWVDPTMIPVIDKLDEILTELKKFNSR